MTVNLGAATGSGQGTDTLAGFEQAVGTQSNDTLIGGAGSNTLRGKGGRDVCNGGPGNDTAWDCERGTVPMSPAGSSDTYRFNLRAGVPVYLDSVTNTAVGGTINWGLVGPTSTLLTTTSAVPDRDLVTSAAGAHVQTISPSSTSVVGSLTFAVYSQVQTGDFGSLAAGTPESRTVSITQPGGRPASPSPAPPETPSAPRSPGPPGPTRVTPRPTPAVQVRHQQRPVRRPTTQRHRHRRSPLHHRHLDPGSRPRRHHHRHRHLDHREPRHPDRRLRHPGPRRPRDPHRHHRQARQESPLHLRRHRRRHHPRRDHRGHLARLGQHQRPTPAVQVRHQQRPVRRPTTQRIVIDEALSTTGTWTLEVDLAGTTTGTATLTVTKP